MAQDAASALTSHVGEAQALSLSPSPSGSPVRRVAIISFQMTKKGPTLWSPHWGEECYHTPKREEFHTRLPGGAGLVKQVTCQGRKGFDEAPSKRPDDLFLRTSTDFTVFVHFSRLEKQRRWVFSAANEANCRPRSPSSSA